ncbi:hypothetical protein MAP00_005743 [Monascus purpureus]|nr:hypothetical protein MAP00_005743 [Monascus purpureus]
MDARVRLRKACDGCNTRKVKCDESGPPCQPCAKLGIPCTYTRPSRRRGPPNRHAEAIIKKQKLTTTSVDSSASSDRIESFSPRPSSIDLPFNNATASAEAICSLPTLRLLIDDYFTYIHPLIPVPHEPTFRAAFERRQDTTDSTFLALLASMVAVLVASFPRRPKLHLKSESERAAFPDSMSLIQRCYEVAIQARGVGYQDRPSTVYDAAASYNLGIASGFVYSVQRSRMYLNECQAMIHVYNLARRPRSPDAEALMSHPEGPLRSTVNDQVNIIEQELGRRLYYLCFVAYRTGEQLASNDGKNFAIPETVIERYPPPLPLEVDDEYIFPGHVEPQPAGTVSQLVGFNANVRVFKTTTDIIAWEIAFGAGPQDWERRRNIIWECLQKAKASLCDVPQELALRSPAILLGSPTLQDQRAIQFEIQKANICVTQLSTRSYLVEKYWNVYELYKIYRERECGVNGDTGVDGSLQAQADTDYIGKMMAEERRQVVKDLFLLVQSVNKINMQPNGASIVCFPVHPIPPLQ